MVRVLTVPRILPSQTGIHNTAKSGRRNGQPQGCSLRSHRLRRLKPLTPTLSPAVHSAMLSMLHCCTSDLKRRTETTENELARSRGGAFRKPRFVILCREGLTLRQMRSLMHGVAPHMCDKSRARC